MKVDNAIILAAGFGSRFVPISYQTPKGLVEVKGEPLVERQIKQLFEVGIKDIIIVTGYLSKKYEYLKEKYDLKIIYNPDYNTMNNFSSLYHVRHHLKNSYILTSDIYMPENIYKKNQPSYSWYALQYFEGKTREWGCSLDSEDRIVAVKRSSQDEWAMYGPAFLTSEDSETLKKFLIEMYRNHKYHDMYWEDALIDNLDSFSFYGKKFQEGTIWEFESLDELRMFDHSYLKNSGHESLDVISKALSCEIADIINCMPMNKGMTNRSFIFEVKNEKYVYRLPGVGTEKLISRQEEKKVYEMIAPYNISDEIIYFDEITGVKISKYYDNAKTLNPDNKLEVQEAMKKLKKLHSLKINVDHHFDLRERLKYYIHLCQENGAKYYQGMDEIEEEILHLSLELYDNLEQPVLCHIDAVHCNYLITKNNDLKLIDWEYSGMAYPLLDVAMFGIYANYSPEKMDLLLELYLNRPATSREIYEFYSFITLSSYLWTLWTVYKETQGDSFGEYGFNQFVLSEIYLDKVKGIMKQ